MSRAAAKKIINRMQTASLAMKRNMREIIDDIYDSITNLTAQTVTASGGFTGDLTGDVTGSIAGASLATERGSGMAGIESYSSTITQVGNKITTHIVLDLTGAVSAATANDIIGDDDAANAHIGQITAAESGTIVSGSMTCLEAPVGGDDDINLNEASVATGAEDADVTALTDYAQLLNSGDWTVGLSQALTALPTDEHYLYLSAGTGDTAAAYTAGKFLIELVGYAE